MTRFGFTGSRHGMSLEQKGAMRKILMQNSVISFSHGDCVGADEEAHEIVANLSLQAPQHIDLIAWPPDNDSLRAFCTVDKRYEPLPYRIRNKRIVDTTDMLIACPNTEREKMRSGTWMTIRIAKRKAKHTPYPIFIISPRGLVTSE